MDKNISIKIKEIRSKYNLSQERFGKKIGVSGKSISAYETGKSVPPLKVLEKISEAYDSAIIHLKDSRKEELRTKFQSIRDCLNDIADHLFEY